MQHKPEPHADEERAFLEGYDPEAFPRPSVAVDVALLTRVEGRLAALLTRRSEPPYRGRWALPGGFVRMDEALDTAATRVLQTKAGVTDVYLEQLYTFGAPKRDPRTRVISVAYYALVPSPFPEAAPASWSPIEVPWEDEVGGAVDVLGARGRRVELAFDHAHILGLVVQRLRGKLDYTGVAFGLLPGTFTLRALQDVHETILGHALNKDSFRRRMLATGWLEPTGERQSDVGHRPAALYRCTPDARQ